MPKALSWTLWTVAIAGCVVAILSVSSQPQPTPSPAASAPPAPKAKPLQTPGSADAFIAKAHRDALDKSVKGIEAELAQIDPWALAYARHALPADYPAWPSTSYADRQRWNKWLVTLTEIDPKRLDRQHQVMLHSAMFLLNRAVHQKHPDPLALLKKTVDLAQALEGCWARNDDCKNQLPGFKRLPETLERQAIASQLNKDQVKGTKTLLTKLSQTFARWTKARNLLPKEWHPVVEQLQATIPKLKKKLRQTRIADPQPFTKNDFERWSQWELGQRASLNMAAQGIEQTRARLKRIQASLTKPAKPKKPKTPSVTQCEQAREALHERFGQSGLWIEKKIDCDRLLALSSVNSEDALMDHLLTKGWIEPTRAEHRARQRPLIAGLASAWGQKVNTQLRQLMFLAQVPELDWAQTRSHQVLREMQQDLCLAQTLLGHLDPSLSPSRKTCPKAPLGDPYRALKGIRTGAMPQTRAVMAGIDRFYWGPLQIALYWATPEGIELGRFGKTGHAHNAPKPGVKVEVQALRQP